ncbi:MAG TPA: molybdopterin cofactor-binding domain-containing protein [Candidatus Limnocylindria bacterium]|jgi:CO/xanthine dehydrogenase Mo-binding subunit/CO/xanthine dehydrogenase FAD-binding subunit|nr:molybdopterin cofactor-binding domain-containing protein [Candidatus Limnocylindria bacterium]
MTVVVGTRVRALGWEHRTSGSDAYAGDLSFEDLLVGRILRSPHPHAEITHLETSRARTMPGVRAVVTAADFPEKARYIHSSGELSDRAPLADKVVRYVGEEIAAVAADSEEEADAALAAIDIRFRVLPAPLSIDEAVAPRATRLHERKTGEPNTSLHERGSWGDVEKARGESAVSAEGTYWYPRVAHAVMEQNVCVARWDKERERLELWTSTQAPFFVVKELAHVFGLKQEQVVCREVAVGGGFGSKSKISEHESIAAALARASGRTVKIALTREEEFSFVKPRHAFRTGIKLHADRTGRISFIEAKIDIDNGAYNHFGPSVMGVGIKTLGSIYTPTAATWDARLIDTALTPGGQFRGYGSPQVSFALDSAVDELAVKMGIDPLEFRLRNANKPGTVALCGARITTARLDDCLVAVRDAIGWGPKKDGKRLDRGIGVSAAMHGSGSYAYPGANTSMAAIDLYADGHVRVRFGGADAGTGQRTILAQIAAEELGVPYEKVEVLSIDSERTPIDQGAWSSRGTHLTGHAVRMAATGLAGRLRAGDTVPADGPLTHEETFTDTVMELRSPTNRTPNFSASYTFAAHACEVEVDRATGRIKILDYVAAHDIGRAINPTMVEGQIIGGAAMALGAALGEELIYEGGRIVNPAYMNYALPRAADVPRVRPILIEDPDPNGPYGAKSIGELAVVPAASAVANAVYDAVGIRLRELPFTPDKVLAALAEKERRRRRRFGIWHRPDRWQIEFVRRSYPLGVHRLLDTIGTRFAKRRPRRAIARVDAPASLGAAVAMLGPDAAPIGGGTDLLLQRRQGLANPTRLVSLGEIPALSTLETAADGALEIGAGVTLSRIARELRERVPALAEAASSIASSQVRAVATVGGNLVQAKRCWFFRNGFDCYKRGGATCPCYAVQGDHRFYHAAIDAHRCQAVTPSDLATALVALDAQVFVEGRGGERVVPMDRFYTGPGETVLAEGELVTKVRIPRTSLERRGAFEKLGLWQGDFALVSAAVAARVDSAGRWRDVRVVLGAIAPVPWRAHATERALEGRAATAEDLHRALDRELDHEGHPLARNAWKLDAALGLATRVSGRVSASA